MVENPAGSFVACSIASRRSDVRGAARLLVRKALEDVLPHREVPPPSFSRHVCLDLLQAKQERLDRGTPFEVFDQLVCERCSEVFATLDLTAGLCRDAARGELPDESDAHGAC